MKRDMAATTSHGTGARGARRALVGDRDLEVEVAQVVVVVTAGVLDQVVLVVRLGLDPVGRRLDRRRDRRLPLAALLHARGDELGGLALRGGRREDRRPILRAAIVALAV